MTDAPAWDGRPLIRPEVDGQHILVWDDHFLIFDWDVSAQTWDDFELEYVAKKGQYITPVLTPNELAAMLAAEREAGRAEEREACAAVCDMHHSSQEHLANSQYADVCAQANAVQDACEELAAAIRSREGKS